MQSLDVSRTIVAKSDQLNADDLIGGPITVKVIGVSLSDSEQPVSVRITGHQPWKPCKTMRRVLAFAWGTDASQWADRWLVLYRDAAVTFGKDAVGGIRIAAMSNIPKRIEMNLAATKGKKAWHVVEVFTPPSIVMSDGDFQRACAAAVKRGWTREQVAQVIGGRAADVSPDLRASLADRLAGAPPAVVAEPEPTSGSSEIGEEERAAILAAEKAEQEL